MSFPKYPEYKDSGVEWFGDVPCDWRVQRLKQVVNPSRPITYGIVQAGENVPDGIPYIRPADMADESGVKTEDALLRTSQEIASAYRRSSISAGDIVCSIGPSFGKLMMVPLSLEGANLTQGTARVAVANEHVPRFIFWVLRSVESYQQWESSVGGATFRALNLGPLAETFLCVPSWAEQTQIAHFLDHETARIDALIEEQQRLIELLKEKRQAVISHAVTKGLDPTVPMKDSGVEWLGEVPAHWKVSKLGHYAQILTGFPFPSASFSHDETDVRLLRGANIGVGSLKWIDTVYWELNEGDELSSYLMTEGQIVLGMDRPWISEGMRIARVTQDDMPCLLLQRVAAITPNAGLNDEYLYCLLASELFKSYVEPDLTGVSVPHISPEQILSFQIPVPHIDEQRKISRFIKDQLDQMSALFQQASESVELLQERRSALISAAVTGKIDVRGWQPPVSTQVSEPAVAEAH